MELLSYKKCMTCFGRRASPRYTLFGRRSSRGDDGTLEIG